MPPHRRPRRTRGRLHGTCRSLRDACRIAHDYDEPLSTDIIGLLMAIHGTVATRLGVTLDPATLDAPADIEQVTP